MLRPGEGYDDRSALHHGMKTASHLERNKSCPARSGSCERLNEQQDVSEQRAARSATLPEALI